MFKNGVMNLASNLIADAESRPERADFSFREPGRDALPRPPPGRKDRRRPGSCGGAQQRQDGAPSGMPKGQAEFFAGSAGRGRHEKGKTGTAAAGRSQKTKNGAAPALLKDFFPGGQQISDFCRSI